MKKNIKITIECEGSGNGRLIYRNYGFDTMKEAQARDWNPDIADMVYTVLNNDEVPF